ncbi:MAG: hypothetical protein WCD38_09240 [Candidatus Tumulicola sp.]
MLRRIEPEEVAATLAATGGARASEPIVPAVAETDLETTGLPHDHPRWVRDAVALSQRARRLLERLAPAVVAVLTVWDHRLRCIIVSGRRVHVDASGSYRVDA